MPNHLSQSTPSAESRPTKSPSMASRVEALTAECNRLATELAIVSQRAADASLARWERENGPADAYVAFFHDCFARLSWAHPNPSVLSNHDQSVIFDAIDRGENSTP